MESKYSHRVYSPWQFLLLLIAAGPLVHAEQFELFTYKVNADRESISITDYPEDAVGHVEIPAEIDGKPVTVIGEGAFSGCRKLTSAALPESVTTIEGAHLWFHLTLGKGAFENCEQLTDLIIPQTVTHFGGNSFKGCKALLSATIPEGVTDIPSGMFYDCKSLTSIVIPKSVIAICYECENGLPAFSGCSALEAILVEAGNPNYASVDGVLFDAGLETAIRCPEGKVGNFAIPQGVTRVAGRWNGLDSGGGEGAFRNCKALTSITIPESVDSIGNEAFYACVNLTAAVFLGDAPIVDENTFANTAPDLTIYYFPSRSGFTSPTWNGYYTVMLVNFTYPAALWLVANGMSQDTDLDQDLNDDGVDLFMAYALNLDPNTNLSSRMPAPILYGDSLALTFHAAAPGVSYSVETSTDLENWTSEGVVISDLTTNKQRTASVPLGAPCRYLRLVVRFIGQTN